MSQPAEQRLALTAGVGCYLIWGLVSLYLQVIGRLGVGTMEMAVHRTFWIMPFAAIFVMLARQGGQVLAMSASPKVVGWLLLSALLLSVNWLVFTWAVAGGKLLEAALGYYINPLVMMAAGALLFGERLDRIAMAAIGLAIAGVAIQALALGHVPLLSLLLAFTFAGYAVVRKQVAVDAQAGLFIESLLLAAPTLGYIIWLERTGHGHFTDSPATAALLIGSGLITGVPLVMFAWAARRMPLSAMGFLQFISPTITFIIGASQGEPLSRLRVLSFGFIWAGAAVFIYGAWRRSRIVAQTIAQSPA